ncbi:MAG: crotonase/enoyl-CoA hydratase family protein [Burkholderiales bacterium]
MTQLVELEIDAHGVAEVRLNRPERMNAITEELMGALRDAAERIQKDPRVRVVVLSGNGRSFCAGLDTSNFAAITAGNLNPALSDLTTRTHGICNRGQYAAWAWHELAVPVIAAVHGVAFGGGLQLALSADIRFVAPDVKLSMMEIKWGLVPDMCGIEFLARLTRTDVARELTFSGRMVAGEEAVQIGLATRVCADPLAAARELAQQIAGRNPDAIRAGKRLLNLSLEASAGDIILAESVEQERILGTANQAEAVRASLEKRAAHFTDGR